MVYITGEDGKEKKFACIKCIKGHRSSKCNHTTRELFEIKKKGRPVSQCESCRQLRKTKQIHIKCVCHLDVKIKDTINENAIPVAVDEGFRYSNLAAVTPTLQRPQPTLLHTGSCDQCNRPMLYCNCSKERSDFTPPKLNDIGYISSSSSDGSVTPPVYKLSYPEHPAFSAGLNHINTTTTTNNEINTPSPTLTSSPLHNEKNPHLRHLTIPIHDPSDDIDSDTPIYKSHEESTTLGEFTNTSSEELMDQIYSGFIGDRNGKALETSKSSPLLREADHQLAELSNDH